MNSFRSLIPCLSALVLCTCLSNATFAQCKGFAKNKCIPGLGSFVHNGQLNTSILMSGEKAELMVTFFQGQEYRVMACAQGTLDSVYFRLLDKNRKPVFNSRDHGNPTFWDFSSGATQQFIIEVEAGASGNLHEITANGCVAVVIGFRPIQ